MAMVNHFEAPLADDGVNATLESFRLAKVGAESTIEITRCSEKIWLVKVTELNGSVSETHISDNTEFLTSITSD